MVFNEIAAGIGTQTATAVGTHASIAALRGAVGKTLSYLAKKHDLQELVEFKLEYFSSCEKLLYVNTLASPESSVYIDEIYVPLTLRGVSTVSLDIGDQSLLDVDGRAVLIKGLAGMGKSTILRKLYANNALSLERLPLFYELKHYRGGPIENSLSKNLNNSGIKIRAEQLERVLDDSNVKLYLDAFDECPPEHRSSLLDEINRITNRYNCHLICTTRPDTELDSMTNVVTYHVEILKQHQIFEIIRKTAVDSEKADSLCEALNNSPLHKDNESILKSPILVVLFCVSYNLGEEIPSTLSQFYSNIFDTVFFKHDNLKGKVNRVRHWNDNKRIYKDIFDYLCFISLRSGDTSFIREKLSLYIADSLNYVNEDASLSDKIADELVSITNLIIQDGYNEYRFVHKSIQEFFAAAFVSKLNPDKKKSFYRACSVNSVFASLFSNTLFFLSEIDYYEYSEHYLVPSVNDLLVLDKKELDNSFTPSKELIDSFLNCVAIHAHVLVVKTKNLKTRGVEKILRAPIITTNVKDPVLMPKLFLTAYSFLGLDKWDTDNLVDYVVKYGELYDDESIYSLRLQYLEDNEKFIQCSVNAALLTAIEIMHRGKYNKAISDLNNRAVQIEDQGYLNFPV